MRHELLTQCALFYWSQCKKGHAESAFRDACRASSGNMLFILGHMSFLSESHQLALSVHPLYDTNISLHPLIMSILFIR